MKRYIESTLEKFYKGYLPDEILKNVIECCKNNEFFYDKITETRDKGGNTATNISSIKYLIKEGNFVKYLEKDILEKFLLNLPEEKKKT